MEGLDTNTILSLLSTPHSLLSVSDARHYLETLDSTLTLMQLYQELFPEDFHNALSQGLSPVPSDTHFYSACEQRFFEHVDRLLFPVPLDYWLAYDPFGERTLAYTIPVLPCGYDFDTNDMYEDLPPGLQLLLYLMGVLDEKFLRENAAIDDEALYAIPIERQNVSRTILTLRCMAQGGPLSFLHQALKMLRNDTDSIFLNVTNNEPYLDATWTKEEVEQLHTQFLLAQDIREQAHRFCEWLEERPLARFIAVVRLWNSCVRDTAADAGQIYRQVHGR